MKITEEFDAGNGRAMIFIVEESWSLTKDDQVPAERVPEIVAKKTRVIVYRCHQLSAMNLEDCKVSLLDAISKKGIKNCSMVGIKGTASLVQAVALAVPKLIRTLTLIDATTRTRSSRREKLIRRIERFMPLGLPFRQDDRGFDAQPFLHRIRCPVLVGTTEKASEYERHQADVLSHGLPTSWRVSFNLSHQEGVLMFAELMMQFIDVPAKRPQRRPRDERAGT